MGRLYRITSPKDKKSRLYAIVNCMTENNIAFRNYLIEGAYDCPFDCKEMSDHIPLNIRKTGLRQGLAERMYTANELEGFLIQAPTTRGNMLKADSKGNHLIILGE